MKSRIILTALLAAITPAGLFAQHAAYPIAPGTSWGWSYVNQGGYVTQTILQDTLMPNGRHYSMIPACIAIGEQFERMQGDTVYAYNPAADKEYILFDFTRSVGDTVNRDNHTVLVSIQNQSVYGATRRTWSFAVNPLPQAIDDEYGYDVTDSIGVTGYWTAEGTWFVRWAMVGSRLYGTLTGISGGNPVPAADYRIAGYPNPFNGQTVVSVSLARGENISVRVYNALGQLVTVLVEGYYSAGDHRIPWDASGVSSGTYFVRLSAGAVSRTARLVIAK